MCSNEREWLNQGIWSSLECVCETVCVCMNVYLCVKWKCVRNCVCVCVERMSEVGKEERAKWGDLVGGKGEKSLELDCGAP